MSKLVGHTRNDVILRPCANLRRSDEMKGRGDVLPLIGIGSLLSDIDVIHRTTYHGIPVFGGSELF